MKTSDLKNDKNITETMTIQEKPNNIIIITHKTTKNQLILTKTILKYLTKQELQQKLQEITQQ